MEQPRDMAAQRLLSRIGTKDAVCGVMGLGFIGSTLMDAIVSVGFQVHGFDRSEAATDRFERWMEERNPGTGDRWSADSDPAVLKDTDVVVVAVRLLWRENGDVDLEPLETAAEILRAHNREPRLVLLETTVPCGTTRRFASSFHAAPGILVAHSPERLSVGHDRGTLRSIPHLLGGMDAAAGRVGACFLSNLCDRVVQVSSPEVSELSKLLENAFLTTGIALSNEVTRMSHAMGIAAEEVCAAAATKPDGYYPFFPGPGMGGHCLGNDLAILRSTSRCFGVESPFLNAVAHTAVAGPDLVLRRLEGLLLARGLRVQNLRILLVGVGFKPETSDTTGSPAREIARRLGERGADLCYLDSQVTEFTVDGKPIRRIDAAGLEDSNIDASIVLAGDRTAPLERLVASSELVFDARGRTREPRPEGVHTL